MRIVTEILGTKIEGVNFQLTKQKDSTVINDRDLDEIANDFSSKEETIRTCKYGFGFLSPNCEVVDKIITYTYNDLTPGTVYNLDVNTYYKEYQSLPITPRRYSTLVDSPLFRRFAVVKPNNLKFEFTLPKTESCNMTFKLLEKDNGRKSFEFYSEMSYFKGANVPNVVADFVVFDRELSSSYGVQYKVEVVVYKETTGNRALTFEFDHVYEIPFPAYLIAVIVVSGLIVLALPGVVYVGVRKWRVKQATRPPKYVSKTMVKPEQLGEILNEWDEHQNAGCEKEWSVYRDIN